MVSAIIPTFLSVCSSPCLFVSSYTIPSLRTTGIPFSFVNSPAMDFPEAGMPVNAMIFKMLNRTIWKLSAQNPVKIIFFFCLINRAND